MLPNPEGIIARASHSLSIRPVRSLDSFVRAWVNPQPHRNPKGPAGGSVHGRPASHRVLPYRKAPLHPSAPLAACGPEFPHLWEREERGGKMWDAGREKVP